MELDAGVLLAGRDHFGFNAEHDPMIESVCADAFEFVMSFAAPNHFDMVFIDLNFEEDNVNVSPPLKFFSAEFLNKLVEITADESGLIANAITSLEQMTITETGQEETKEEAKEMEYIVSCSETS